METRRLLAGTIYVDVYAPGPTHDGMSWATAYTDLQQALAAAVAGSGVQIRVADGTYSPTTGADRNATFQLKSGVSVFGGYAGYGATDPEARDITANATILSGDIGAIGSNADNSYHVVTGSGTDNTAVLSGFAITAGNADGTGGGYSTSGGGMLNNGVDTGVSWPVIADCIFAANSAAAGGAVYNTFTAIHASPTFTNCLFVNNTATSGGGAMYCGFSAPKLVRCTFENNSAGTRGGALYTAAASSSVIDCVFKANAAFGTGVTHGGGAVYNTDSSPTIINCSFVGNRAINAYGGALYNGPVFGSATLVACTIVANSAATTGGGVRCERGTVALKDCVLWGNTAAADPQASQSSVAADITITASDIQGGWVGTGNIDADPLFVRNPAAGPDNTWGTADDDYGDLRLRISSLCIDAGDNAAIPPQITTDLAGNPRFVDVPTVHDPGAIVDMGAYEYNLPLAATSGDYLFNAARPSIRLEFNGDLSPTTVTPSDLILQNLTTGQMIDVGASATVTYDPATRSATWAFAILLPDGDYRATLPASVVSDELGNALGSDFSFDFFALAGDANRDGRVNLQDFNILAANFGQSPRDFTQGDFNYDSVVNLIDFNILAGNFGVTLAAPQPAGASSAPTKTHFGDSQISSKATDDSRDPLGALLA